jgi:hypothetical protein
MPDEASILRVAEHDRDHAATLLTEHTRTCDGKIGRMTACPDCTSLRYHAARTQRQVDLLTPAPVSPGAALF